MKARDLRATRNDSFLELGLHRGRAFFSYLPRALHDDRVAIRSMDPVFRALQLELGARPAVGAADYRDRLDELSSTARMCGDLTVASFRRGSLFDATVALSANARLSRIDLVHGNALLFGRTRVDFRSGPAWMDSDHPADSWFVPPRHERLRSFVDDLCVFTGDKSTCSLLRASVAMQRLADLHPFADGNGRLSRALFLGTCSRELGFNPVLPAILERAWRNGAVELHPAGGELRASGDWMEFLQQFARWIRDAIRTVP